MKILRFISVLIALWAFATLVWAADEAAIEGLQFRVNLDNNRAANYVPGVNSLKGATAVAMEARIAAFMAALTEADGTISQLQADLAAATDQIRQLQVDLNAEVAARQAADNELHAAYVAADANLKAQIDVLGSVDIGALESRVGSVEEILTCVTYDVITRDLIFVGCNVHIRDGSGLTQSTSGLGNLIIGYNADASGILDRFGSHNLILGDEQAYTKFGQLLTQFVGSSRNMSVVVEGNLTETVFSNRTTNIGRESTLSVGQDLSTLVGGNFTKLIENDLTVEAGKSMSLTIADGLAIASGTGSIRIDKNGDIVMEGKKISMKASGDIVMKGRRILQN